MLVFLSRFLDCFRESLLEIGRRTRGEMVVLNSLLLHDNVRGVVSLRFVPLLAAFCTT